MRYNYIIRECHTPKICGPKPPFSRRLRNLTATLTASTFRMKHDIHRIIGQVRLKLQEVSYVVSKVRELWSTNKRLKIGPVFNLSSVNSALYFIARLCIRRSTNRIQPKFVKRWTINRANNLLYNSWDGPFQKNWGPKNCIHLVVLSTSSRLIGLCEYIRNKT